jgi:mRNA interferase MazF
MERFIKGDVVVVPFPFSDLSQAKKRPALVITNLEGDDIILCQVTSKFRNDTYAITITDDDFQMGNLKQPSNVRPNRIFTADKNLIIRKVGSLKLEKQREVIERVVDIIKK